MGRLNYKGEIKMNNNFKKPISYQISKRTFYAMLEDRTEAEKKENPYDYAMKIINQNYGLKGIVKNLSVI